MHLLPLVLYGGAAGAYLAHFAGRDRRIGRLATALLCVLVLASCTKPEVKKREYYDKGMALAAQKNYADAIVEFRNALKIDAKYGEARLALADAAIGQRTGDEQVGQGFAFAGGLRIAQHQRVHRPVLAIARLRGRPVGSGRIEQFRRAGHQPDFAFAVQPQHQAYVLDRAQVVGGRQFAERGLENRHAGREQRRQRAAEPRDGDLAQQHADGALARVDLRGGAIQPLHQLVGVIVQAGIVDQLGHRSRSALNALQRVVQPAERSVQLGVQLGEVRPG